MLLSRCSLVLQISIPIEGEWRMVGARSRGKARRTLGSWLVSKVNRPSTSFLASSGNHEMFHRPFRSLPIFLPFFFFSTSFLSLSLSSCSNKQSQRDNGTIRVLLMILFNNAYRSSGIGDADSDLRQPDRIKAQREREKNGGDYQTIQ